MGKKKGLKEGGRPGCDLKLSLLLRDHPEMVTEVAQLLERVSSMSWIKTPLASAPQEALPVMLPNRGGSRRHLEGGRNGSHKSTTALSSIRFLLIIWHWQFKIY